MKTAITSGRQKRRRGTQDGSSRSGSNQQASLPLYQRLKEIRDGDCTACPLSLQVQTVCVAGDGGASKPVLVLGEAPGRVEDEKGAPFLGQAGRLLKAGLSEAGLGTRSLWLTNAVKCYPHGTPEVDEIDVCSNLFLRREIETLKPAWILALGKSAVLASCAYPRPITQMRGQISLSKNFGEHSCLVFPTYHPAYILRQRGGRREAEWKDDLWKFARIVEFDVA